MGEINVINDNITTLKVDAIVNAANKSLCGGGGVDGAIHRGAGPELLAYCRTLGGCETGAAKITSGYNLPAKYIIHTVGPVWSGGDRNEEQLLHSCYTASLTLAEQNGVKSIAFPAISCGAYRFPITAACRIALDAIRGWLKTPNQIELIYLVCFEEKIERQYLKIL